ncbi:MAG: BMP family ABC transporter substrate-binding protein, partial [bacterium]|nr:BMP family ABC transporter substrate-binding protein [bacterium]
GKDTNPDIQVVLEWAGTWTDQQKIEQMAQQQIDSGADVLSVNAGQGGLAIHALAEKIGVFTIGWIEDYYDLAPGAVITSVVMDYPRLIVTGATLAREGRWEGKQYKFGMREEALYLAPFRGMLTPEQEARVQAVQNDIMQGKIDLTP